MMKRLVIALVFLTSLVLVGLPIAFLLLSTSRVDRERFEAIREGMSQPEVERLLGGPRNECREPVIVWAPREGKVMSAEIAPGELGGPYFPDAGQDEKELVWVGYGGLIAARLGNDGRVRDKYFSEVHSPGRPLLAFPAPSAPRASNPTAQEPAP